MWGKGTIGERCAWMCSLFFYKGIIFCILTSFEVADLQICLHGGITVCILLRLKKKEYESLLKISLCIHYLNN